MRQKLIIILCMIASLGAWGQKTYTYTIRDTMEMKLDVYSPQQPRADKACVIYVFGGGFFTGARDDSASVIACKRLTEQGFTAISIDYRLKLGNISFDTVKLLKAYKLFYYVIDEAVADCCSAIKFVYEHASELNIDKEKIILTGSSAGAITVLQTDYSRANHLNVARELPSEFIPAAVIPYAGAIYTLKGKVHYDTPPAPTCFFHGTKDRIVNYHRFHASLQASLNGSDKLEKIFEKNHYNHWILRYEGIGHEVAGYLPKTIEEFTAFVDAVLSGRDMDYDATCKDTACKPTPMSKMSVFDLYLK